MSNEARAGSGGSANPVMIEVHHDLLDMLKSGWSPAVNILIIESPSGKYQMIAMRHTCPTSQSEVNE